MLDFDPYAILEVERTCDGETLKLAYRRLVRENHPDVASDKAAATVRMTQINAAWALVGEPGKRAEFDLRQRFDELQRFDERQRRERSSRVRPPSVRSSPRPPAHQEAPRPASAKSSSSTPRSASSSGGRNARLAEASRLLFKQNRPQDALELCRAILKTDFRNIPARELMGEAYLRLGQSDRALAVWEQALVLSPNNATLRRRYLQHLAPDKRPPGESVEVPMSRPRPRKQGLLKRLFRRK